MTISVNHSNETEHTPYVQNSRYHSFYTYIVYIDAGIQVELFLRSAYHTFKLYTLMKTGVCASNETHTKKENQMYPITQLQNCWLLAAVSLPLLLVVRRMVILIEVIRHTLLHNINPWQQKAYNIDHKEQRALTPCAAAWDTNKTNKTAGHSKRRSNIHTHAKIQCTKRKTREDNSQKTAHITDSLYACDSIVLQNYLLLLSPGLNLHFLYFTYESFVLSSFAVDRKYYILILLLRSFLFIIYIRCTDDLW